MRPLRGNMIGCVTLNPSIDKYAEVDGLHYDDVLRLENTSLTAGGKGVNVSKVLKNLGLDSLNLGFAGGKTGQEFQDLLKKNNLLCDFTSICGETRTNLTVFDRTVKKTVKLNEPGPEILQSELDAFMMKFEAHLEYCSFMVFSGSLPRGVNPGIYNQMAEMARDRHIKVLLDTESGVLAEALSHIKVDVIKPNRYEAERLAAEKLNGEGDFVRALHKIYRYAALPVITDGENGAYFKSEERCYHVLPPKVNAMSTVGSGDAFVAGLIAGSYLREKEGLLGAFQLASACGTATAQKGALCEEQDIINIEKRVVITEIY